MIESRDQRVLAPDVAAAYARVLGITRAWLVLGEGNAPLPNVVCAAVALARDAKEADPNEVADEVVAVNHGADARPSVTP